MMGGQAAFMSPASCVRAAVRFENVRDDSPCRYLEEKRRRQFVLEQAAFRAPSGEVARREAKAFDSREMSFQHGSPWTRAKLSNGGGDGFVASYFAPCVGV